MRFSVFWEESAEEALANLFLDSSDRYEIRVASDRIDELLKTQADRIGSEVHEGLRSLKATPLKVLFFFCLDG